MSILPAGWAGSHGAPVLTTRIDRDRREIDVSSEILRLNPNATPFLAVLANARKKTVTSPEYHWWDEELVGWWTEILPWGTTSETTDTTWTVTGTTPITKGEYGASATVFKVADASIFRKGDTAKITGTGEVVIVTGMGTDDGKDTITVVREAGKGITDYSGGIYGEIKGTTKGVIEFGYETDDFTGTNRLMRLGPAMEEFSVSPDPRAYQPTKFWNYIQTFRNSFSGSYDDLAEGKRTSENERVRLTRNYALLHMLDIERQLLFGERAELVDATSREVRRLTGGLLQFIAAGSNAVSASDFGSNSSDTTLDRYKWEQFCEVALKYGNKSKLAIMSPRVGSIINEFAMDKIQTRTGEDTYGIRLSRYNSFHGTLEIATSHLFENEYEGMVIVVDVPNLAYNIFDGKDSTLFKNILTNNNPDGWKDEYMTKAGLEVRLLKTHAVMDGISTVLGGGPGNGNNNGNGDNSENGNNDPESEP